MQDWSARSYRLKSAVREIGKALALPTGELEKLSRLAEQRSAAGLADEIASLPEFKDRADGHLEAARRTR